MKSKCLKTLIVILFCFNLFFFCSKTFANVIDYTEYNYTFSNNDEVKSLAETAKNDSRVLSGDYYYFVYYSLGDYCYNSILIPKNKLDYSRPLLLTDYWSQSGGIAIYVLLGNSDFSDDVIYLAGRAGVGNEVYNGNSYGVIYLTGYYDESDKTSTVSLATNFDRNMYIPLSNGTEKVFLTAPAQGILAPRLEQVEMSQPMMTILGGFLKYLVPLVVLLVAFWKGWQLLLRLLERA